MTFLETYDASFGSWAPVLRAIYLINLTGQKQYVIQLKWICLAIMSGHSPEIIFSPVIIIVGVSFNIIEFLQKKLLSTG